METKRCFKCGEIKARADFYRHPAMADGLLGKCKECARRDVRETRLAKQEYYQAYDRSRGRTEERKRKNRERARSQRVANPEISHKRTKEARAKNPIKYRARNAVSNAIRDGRLTKQPCEICGSSAHAHHEDYSKPLEVRWLCQTHHGERHRQYA